MKTIQVATDLHCDMCIDKVAKHFDKNEKVHEWNVDTIEGVKRLSVTGLEISNDLIQNLLEKEGYHILGSSKTNNFSWKNPTNWKRASFNTLNCLIGCSIGDFGMIIYLQAYYPQTSMLWQMILAIIAGLTTSILLETVILKYRENFAWLAALKTAFGMSFISMVGMEIAMNTTDFMFTGGKAAFDDPMYWMAILLAMVAGFLAPLPYNYYKLQMHNKACH